jgi:hypothetical protein
MISRPHRRLSYHGSPVAGWQAQAARKLPQRINLGSRNGQGLGSQALIFAVTRRQLAQQLPTSLTLIVMDEDQN